MGNLIPKSVEQKRFQRRLNSKKKAKNKRRHICQIYLSRIRLRSKQRISRSGEQLDAVFEKYLSTNIKYLLKCENSNFYIKKIKNNLASFPSEGRFMVPEHFSLIQNPKESYRFIEHLLTALISQKYKSLTIDYSYCNKLELGAQVFLDIILKDMIHFYKKCESFNSTKPFITEIKGEFSHNNEVNKMLHSVGTPVIHLNLQRTYSDVIPYKLCIHNANEKGNPNEIMEQKNIDTTMLVDYVVNSLKLIGRTLTSDKIHDLSTVIGEILINAEEHSTTKCRFSIGYFQKIESNDGQNNNGLFRLVILNFGKTIYEKFRDPECPNQQTVEIMRALSDKYHNKNYFSKNLFHEETLWTLYALQEGVTSIAPYKYQKRGHGSIQFIESFFNLKGNNPMDDDTSNLTILSGNAIITFDGTYNINNRVNSDGEIFKCMTFNNSATFEERPDPKFVRFAHHYFPGTIISARILLNNDDFKTH